jgi:hypothetical protein
MKIVEILQLFRFGHLKVIHFSHSFCPGQTADTLDWWRATGNVDPELLRQATGTTTVPRKWRTHTYSTTFDSGAPFAIVATGRSMSPSTAATLVSDPIACQKGDSELRFKYWTSPSVRLQVCLKAMAHQLPNYDYCAVVPPAGPGPAFVTIPGPLTEPFEVASTNQQTQLALCV